MAYFINPTKRVDVPLPIDFVVLPDYSLVYGIILNSLDCEKRDEIQKKLHLVSKFDDKVMDFFYMLGLLERFSIIQKKGDFASTPDEYHKYELRVIYLMSIFGCVTENFIEDQELCRAFLWGVTDFHKDYEEVFE